jgi:hypothetical protein
MSRGLPNLEDHCEYENNVRFKASTSKYALHVAHILFVLSDISGYTHTDVHLPVREDYKGEPNNLGL